MREEFDHPSHQNRIPMWPDPHTTSPHAFWMGLAGQAPMCPIKATTGGASAGGKAIQPSRNPVPVNDLKWHPT